MINLLSVFIGGGIGSVLRWMCCHLIINHWGTFVVNVLGAFFIGVAYTYFEKYTNLPPATKTFIMTGLLGGFTTFSTYLLNFTTLFNQNSPNFGTGPHEFVPFFYQKIQMGKKFL